MKQKKVIFCVPTLTRPYPAFLESLKASIPLIQAAGWDEGMVNEIGCPYISAARATMLRKALTAGADVIVFLDHDLSWSPESLLKLIETEGDVVAGLYRFKYDDKEQYMGAIQSSPVTHCPLQRSSDGCIKADRVPAGFLKITRATVNRFMEAYPHLKYGEACTPSVDLFNHGAHKGEWWGEDYAFCRNWLDIGGDIWVVPNVTVNHHHSEGVAGCPDRIYRGNFHEFMLRQPGGSNFSALSPAEEGKRDPSSRQAA